MALTPGMLPGFGAQLLCQELAIPLLAGMHFTSLVQENRARKIPVALGPFLCHPAPWHGVAQDGVTLPFPDLPTPSTRSSSFKKIKLFSSTPLDNQVEESQPPSGFYQHLCFRRHFHKVLLYYIIGNFVNSRGSFL